MWIPEMEPKIEKKLFVFYIIAFEFGPANYHISEEASLVIAIECVNKHP